MKLVAILAVVIAAALVVLGILPRIRARDVLAQETKRQAAPTVTVVHPRKEAPSEEVILPADVQAFVESPIYARTSGYLKRWYFDLGARVKKGQLLAEIESPEVDQQLKQAREDLVTAQANLKLAQITADRYVDLYKTESVSKQDVDTAVQNAAARVASVKSAQANVGRLQQQVEFERVVAPFDGVITARNTDIGQLIEAGPGHELFHLASLDRLRVFVNVPQLYSHDAVPGIKADLTLPELPGRRFTGTLVRTAGAFDPRTRTLLVEVDMPNRDKLLYPGAYAQMHFRVTSRVPTLLVPPTALIFRSEGLRAATVVNEKAVLTPITLGRDFGNEVEVVAGLNEDSLIIVNPPDSLVDGEAVRIVAHKIPKPPPENKTAEE